ncbi:MAG: hypothetical protein KDK36_17115, partial [Leptospiraceae bacterium]|nr:hypothetical protein [Leptospiraceae bacterium]
MRTRFNLLLTILFFISTSILSEEGANNKFHIGAEIGELGYSKLDKFGTKNYSILFGQKFSQNTWKNFGWRFSSFDVILQDSHLENIIFVKGNTADIEARQSVQRLYLDYYLPGWKKSFFEINPIIS